VQSTDLVAPNPIDASNFGPVAITNEPFKDVLTCENQVASDSTAQLNGSTTVVRQQQRTHGAIAEFFSFNSFLSSPYCRLLRIISQLSLSISTGDDLKPIGFKVRSAKKKRQQQQQQQQ